MNCRILVCLALGMDTSYGLSYSQVWRSLGLGWFWCTAWRC